MPNTISHTGSIRSRLARVPLFTQIVIANSIIIIMGAIGGTLLTSHLTDVAADVWLIFLFASIGTTMTILINGWLIKIALRPLRELNQVISRVQADYDSDKTGSSYFQQADPDIPQMAEGLNLLVTRLEEHNRQLKALSKRAISAQEEERKRIARSLHDDSGQALSMLIINLERLENMLPPDQIDLHNKLVKTRQLALQSLSELRKIIYGLRPTVLDDLGLVPAIRWYARSTLEEVGIRVDVIAKEDIGPINAEIKTTLFRIVQEAINNIVKHSAAKTATISLNKNKHQYILHVQDDGLGFDVEKSSEQAIRLQQCGLLGIRERAELVRAEIRVSSQQGHGTRIEVMVPIPKPGEYSE
ncbi:MAG: sensor histidine kinase [Anaerolineales bacterium]|nr:MAG: sensor histidine kinase [Anaerolineales bacterium]